MPAGNIGLAIWRLKCFYETFVQASSAVILLNFCGENSPHRQAETVSSHSKTNTQKRNMGIFDKLFKTKKMQYEIVRDENGKHQIGGEVPQDFTIPANEFIAGFQYLGFIDNLTQYFLGYHLK
jgi:hypothetical protein